MIDYLHNLLLVLMWVGSLGGIFFGGLWSFLGTIDEDRHMILYGGGLLSVGALCIAYLVTVLG